jgi:hypothetical protein
MKSVKGFFGSRVERLDAAGWLAPLLMAPAPDAFALPSA